MAMGIKHGVIRVLVFNRELRFADHYLYLRPLSESYINI